MEFQVASSSDRPSNLGQRSYLRSALLSEFVEDDLYSALLLAAADSIDVGLKPAERAVAAARKAAAMREIEAREAPRPRWTPSGGIERLTPPPSARR